MNVPFIERERCGRDLAALSQSAVRAERRWAGPPREILTPSGRRSAAEAGLAGGSVSRLAQLSSRGERRPFTPAAKEMQKKEKR